MKPLKLHWASGLKNGRRNFGDWLSVDLVSWLAGREVEHAPPGRAELIAAGSLLQRLGYHFWSHRVWVWGTGYIEARAPHWTPHRYAAVRGRLSAGLLKNRAVPALGDPGLLVGRRFPRYTELPRHRRLGLVPHYKDQSSPQVQALLARIPGSVSIDILGGVEEVIRAIGECELVLSSSLHGLIVADALRVPNAWLKLSDEVRGADFKFRDYYSVFGLESEPAAWLPARVTPEALESLTADYRRPGLEHIADSLIDAFPFR